MGGQNIVKYCNWLGKQSNIEYPKKFDIGLFDPKNVHSELIFWNVKISRLIFRSWCFDVSCFIVNFILQCLIFQLSKYLILNHLLLFFFFRNNNSCPFHSITNYSHEYYITVIHGLPTLTHSCGFLSLYTVWRHSSVEICFVINSCVSCAFLFGFLPGASISKQVRTAIFCFMLFS